MLVKWVKRIAGVAVLAAIVAATVYALMPSPVPVDLAIIERGPLHVTVDEEGVARIRDVFRVSAPVAGRVERLPVEVGDRVHKGTSAVAVIHPMDPPFLDVRTRRELEAAVSAAVAAVTLAEAQVVSAETSERLARSEVERAQPLARGGTIALSVFDRIVANLDNAKAAVEQARAALLVRQSELNSTEARLIEPDRIEGSSRDACCLTVRAPSDGIVLKLLSDSEQVITAGSPLIEIGDPRQMEIVIHLLSSDAVKISEGAAATLDDWGGGSLQARVRRIDPAAYTKVSALGIEEQRVDAALDVADPYELWQRLGHEFRVMAHIAVWRGDDVVRVPLGALFRRGSQWNVFRVVDGRAVITPVEVGHRNPVSAEVVSGLAPGDQVILHPSDRVADGVTIAPREELEG